MTTEKKVLTNITFQENCEYESSSFSTKIDVPTQLVDISISIINRDGENDTFYYDDLLEVQAEVKQGDDKYIKVGRVEFYFIDEYGHEELINKETTSNNKYTCSLNAQGTTSLLFKPTQQGQIYAKYIDYNGFYIAPNPSEKKNIILKERPVNIEFTEVPPFLTDVNEEITLTAKVTDAKDPDNRTIQYGTVTFLHYMVKNDIDPANKRVPKIIGNPVQVIDGEATINYIPVQTDDDEKWEYTEAEIMTNDDNTKRYVEYIAASYNYSGKYIDADKEEYKWKYYDSKTVWGGIAVCARDSLTINPLPLSSEDNIGIHMEGETGIYTCKETDNITLTAVLKDKYDKQITFNDHSGVVTFHVKGGHAHPKVNHVVDILSSAYTDAYAETIKDFNFMKIEENVGADFENDIFYKTLSLLPGFYTITATATVQSDLNGTNDDYMDDRMYAEVHESNTIYVYVSYNDVSCNINLSHDTGVVKTQEPLNNLQGIVTNITDKQKNILNNMTCYFYVSELNKTYRGVLKKEGNQLIGRPSEQIIFDVPRNYHIYMYIPEGVYTDDINMTLHSDITSSDKEFNDFYLPLIMKNPITIQARNNFDLILSGHIDDFTLTYNIEAKFLSEDITVRLEAADIYSSQWSVLEDNITIYKQSPFIVGEYKFNNGSEYRVRVVYNNDNDVTSNEMLIEVQKDKLNQVLLESSKNTLATINNTVGVFLSCDVDIERINQNNIKAYLYDNNQANKKEINISEIVKKDNKTLYLSVNPEIYTEGKWYLEITYPEDVSFQAHNNILSEFNTFLDTPSITLRPYDNTYDFNVQGKYNVTDAIVIVLGFRKGTKPLGQNSIIITDEKGYGIFKTNEPLPEWWDSWDNVTFIFEPFNEALIDSIKNDTIKQKYEIVFDDSGKTNSTTSNSYIQNQLINNNDKYIYHVYKPTQIMVRRPNQI